MADNEKLTAQVVGASADKAAAGQAYCELFDDLTGLPAMNNFFRLAERRKAALIAEGRNPVLLFFDFNRMKNFNTRFGFAEGDKLIIAMAEILAKHFGRENCGRFGGDRFAAISRECGLEEELDQIVEESRHMNNGRTLSLRIGVYPNRVGDVGIGIACDRAKMACDVHRNSYVSGYSYFSEEMLEAVEKRRYIIDNLDRALSERWIQVYYQPIIRAANGRVCDEEALARWIDPERGFMSPADFIPILEDARLIYKLDLYMTERLLEKMAEQKKAGLFVVPSSVNISRSDFEACDIVEEIRKRVDASGFGRDMITIEITESTIGRNFEYMKKQVERFQELGFKVWMDDYGSGYSSPVILQKLHFDTIKLDMEFLANFDKGDDSKIILSSLIKMAIGLGMDTVVEGVETKEQAEFLKEVGCTKLQGYYYCKPIPVEQIMARYQSKTAIGFENPDETGYYSTLGRVNLYELSVSADNSNDFDNYFNTMPMAIVEIREKNISVIRCNKTFKEFYISNVSKIQFTKSLDDDDFDKPFRNALMHCANEGRQTILDLYSRFGKKIHMLIRRLAVNPVNDARSMVVVILSISDESSMENGLSYDAVAQALSADYRYLFHVDLESERFVEYRPDDEYGDIKYERRGENYFSESRKDAAVYIYEEDREYFTGIFTKENVVKSIDEHGAFTLTYRINTPEGPSFVDMKAIRIGREGRYIIIAVYNVDARMRTQKEMERINEERMVYSRISALAGNYIAYYTVEPDTGKYIVFSATREFDELGLSKVGDDFYKDAVKEGKSMIFAEDREMFVKAITKAKILKQIEKKGMFRLVYRVIDGEDTRYVCLKAAMVIENGKKTMIVGVSDVDEQIKRDRDYTIKLSAARNKVNLDELTGVKNKHAFIDVENQIDTQIEEGNITSFALVILDIIGVHVVNDRQGHRAGDEFIKQGCRSICEVFHHSPVFRVGGDEFAVVAAGRDYEQIDVLMDALMKRNKLNASRGGLLIAAGMARYNNDANVDTVFRRADRAMYENKKILEGLKEE